MSVSSVLPVTEIRDFFQHKPESYEVDLHPTCQAILKIRKKLMANLSRLTCDIPNSNNNWKLVLMTEDEYLLAQCRQHGYDSNSKDKVVLGKKERKIFDRPKVKPAGYMSLLKLLSSPESTRLSLNTTGPLKTTHTLLTPTLLVS